MVISNKFLVTEIEQLNQNGLLKMCLLRFHKTKKRWYRYISGPILGSKWNVVEKEQKIAHWSELLCNYRKIHTFNSTPSNLALPKLLSTWHKGKIMEIDLCMDYGQDKIAPNVQISHLCKHISNYCTRIQIQCYMRCIWWQHIT